MDPEACLREAESAATDGEMTVLTERLWNLCVWLSKGGAVPRDMDQRLANVVDVVSHLEDVFTVDFVIDSTTTPETKFWIVRDGDGEQVGSSHPSKESAEFEAQWRTKHNTSTEA
jgi:hypothetical protein